MLANINLIVSSALQCTKHCSGHNTRVLQLLFAATLAQCREAAVMLRSTVEQYSSSNSNSNSTVAVEVTEQ